MITRLYRRWSAQTEGAASPRSARNSKILFWRYRGPMAIKSYRLTFLMMLAQTDARSEVEVLLTFLRERTEPGELCGRWMPLLNDLTGRIAWPSADLVAVPGLRRRPLALAKAFTSNS